ncbi:MAG: hypothetical protein KGH49_02660 [Candidatus Micrarchaeota archaeon]|nr:hypothetical protein [Candidatus Micrarchaeota archaeon]
MIGAETIADVYSRLSTALGSDKIVIMGGAAVKLAADPQRKISDVDVIVLLPYSDFIRREKRLALMDFKLRTGKTISLYDKRNRLELDLGTKRFFGPKGESFGMQNGAIASSSATKIIKSGVGQVNCRIMGPAQLLEMKVWLLLNRTHHLNKKAMDKRDIISILKKFY